MTRLALRIHTLCPQRKVTWTSVVPLDGQSKRREKKQVELLALSGTPLDVLEGNDALVFCEVSSFCRTGFSISNTFSGSLLRQGIPQPWPSKLLPRPLSSAVSVEWEYCTFRLNATWAPLLSSRSVPLFYQDAGITFSPSFPTCFTCLECLSSSFFLGERKDHYSFRANPYSYVLDHVVLFLNSSNCYSIGYILLISIRIILQFQKHVLELCHFSTQTLTVAIH